MISILAVNGYHSLADYKRALNPNGVYVIIGGSIAAMFQAMLLGPLVIHDRETENGSMGVAQPNQKIWCL